MVDKTDRTLYICDTTKPRKRDDCGGSVSNFFKEEQTPPRQPGSYSAFGPKPEALAKVADETKAEYGEDSFEYASAVVKVGDAHMVQGRLSNPLAQRCYEQALSIVQGKNPDSAELAFVLDKLANVKQSSGDTTGAVNDLKKALELWKTISPDATFVSVDYITRRSEDLDRMERVIAFRNIRPPES